MYEDEGGGVTVSLGECDESRVVLIQISTHHGSAQMLKKNGIQFSNSGGQCVPGDGNKSNLKTKPSRTLAYLTNIYKEKNE